MSAFERLLVPGCTELPECRCGKEMQIASIDPLPERSDAHIRVYGCPRMSPRNASYCLGFRHSGLNRHLLKLPEPIGRSGPR